jgi:hypothetical protein
VATLKEVAWAGKVCGELSVGGRDVAAPRPKMIEVRSVGAPCGGGDPRPDVSFDVLGQAAINCISRL